MPFLYKLQNLKCFLCPTDNILHNTVAKCKSCKSCQAQCTCRKPLALQTKSPESNGETQSTTVEKRGAFTLHEHKPIHTNKELNEGFPSAAHNF